MLSYGTDTLHLQKKTHGSLGLKDDHHCFVTVILVMYGAEVHRAHTNTPGYARPSEFEDPLNTHTSSPMASFSACVSTAGIAVTRFKNGSGI